MNTIEKITDEIKTAVIGEEEEVPEVPPTELEDISRRLTLTAGRTNKVMHLYYDMLAEGKVDDRLEDEIDEKLSSFRRSNAEIFKAYQLTANMTDELGARLNDTKKSRKHSIIPAPPANSYIDRQEEITHHFARGTNFYKLFLICSVGSFIGVVLELLWCLVTNGYLESRSGLIYGPFNLLYGIGAAALTAFLYRYRNRGAWLSFLGGFVVGSLVEYVCSWAQELCFGSRSWDYSDMPFNINGRVCLLYSVIWGILGVLWIKNLYPRAAYLILKIPDVAGKIATWVLLAFFAFNAVVTCVTIYRWSQRDSGVSANSGFWELIDDRFPDERMSGVFANMTFGDGEKTPNAFAEDYTPAAGSALVADSVAASGQA